MQVGWAQTATSEEQLLPTVDKTPLLSSERLISSPIGRVFPRSPNPGEHLIPDKNEPVLLTAQHVYYDQQNDTVTAEGKVELTQGESMLQADRLTYYKAEGRVEADGNVSMLESTGHTYFAEHLSVENTMAAGVIEQFRARLVDDSLFSANKAKRINDHVIELEQAVYSPCKVNCSTNADDDPLWQIRADRVTIDQEEQKIIYHGADMEFYGIPVIYSPYFAHSTPGADNQSGLLTPEASSNQNLGFIYKQPVYYSIAPDKDATLTPIITGREGMVLAGQYREKFDNGLMTVDGSATDTGRRNANGDRIAGNEFRGNVDAHGDFREGDNYDWGFSVRRTTDDTYLRRYNFSNDTLLTSRLYGEGYNFIPDSGDRTYASVQALDFQGLLATDDPKRIPVILPMVDFTHQSLPGLFNSRMQYDANLLSLYRDDGAKTQRASGTIDWRIPYITRSGQIIEMNTSMRSDVYAIHDQLLSSGQQFDGTQERFIPQISALWRYPFINQFARGSVILEPVVLLTASPDGGNSERIPNEDSLVSEFTDTNLFDDDRFAGLDRVETSPRISYGLRGQAEYRQKSFVDWVFGQQYRVTNDANFPFSSDLDSHLSDYVGRVGLLYNPFSIAYRFRLDKDNLSAKRSEVDGTFSAAPVTISTAYLSLKNDPILASKEEIVGSVSYAFTPVWTVNLGTRYDLLLDQMTTLSGGLTFKNECMSVMTVIGREYTRDRDIEPSTTYLVRVAFKNLE